MFLSIDTRTDYIQSKRDIYLPFILHIKSVFRIGPLPVRGFHKVSAIVLLSVLLYPIRVYYNCKKDKLNPKSIKYILWTYWHSIEDKDELF